MSKLILKKVVSASVRCAVVGTVFAGGGVAFAANPTQRNWVVDDGYVDAATSWENGVLPAQGTANASGEMAYFTGSGDKTVRFPASGWTDTGIYYFAKELDDGTTLTFDATGTVWTFGAGKYFSNWQVFTLCGGGGHVGYPHILQVSLSSATASESVFTLTDGIVRLYKSKVAGSVLSLERGTWDFTGLGTSGTLYLFNAEAGVTDKVVLKEGTSLRTPSLLIAPSSYIKGAEFVVEGGEHAFGALTVGENKTGQDWLPPVLYSQTAGTVSANAIVVGNRAATGETVLELGGSAVLTGTSMVIANAATGATVRVSGDAALTVAGELKLGRVANGVGNLVLGDRAVVTAQTVSRGSGAAQLTADGGTLVFTASGGGTLANFDSAWLGAGGLTLRTAVGRTDTCSQAFTDLDGADGLFAKEGLGTLAVSTASEHAKTAVRAGFLSLASGVTRFGRTLEIASGAAVLVAVPATAGEHTVLTLDAPLGDAELARIAPADWVDGFDYAMSQTTADGTTTVLCTVAESSGDGSVTVGESTTFSEEKTIKSSLTVSGEGIAIVFEKPVAFDGGKVVIDVPTGSTVTFAAPVSGANVEIEKKGAGQVVFKAASPEFLGSWIQKEGTFAYEGDGVTFAGRQVVLSGASEQKRFLARVEGDLELAGGLTSTGGGLVKTGAGALTLVESAGEYYLNTGFAAASDKALASVPADGSAPADADAKANGVTAGAALQVLSGAVRVKGAGQQMTTVMNQQSIFIGTAFAPTAQPGLEISDCTYKAGGTARTTTLATGMTSTDFNAPYLTLDGVFFPSHRLELGGGSPTVDVYPTVTMTDSTVAFESGFNVGCANDRVHPRLVLDHTKVTQWRDGYAMGHYFYRDFDVTLRNGATLAAQWSSKAGANWHGLRFENGAWGTLRVTGGSKIQTSRIETLNANATEAKRVDFIFDGGILEMTADESEVEAKTAFAAPAVQGFTTTGAGMEVLLADGITHTFATPFRGDGDVVKTGAGTMALAAVSDGGQVFRNSGVVEVREGTLDLGGLDVREGACVAGAGGVVSNGTCTVSVNAGSSAVPLRAGDATVIGRVVVEAGGTTLAKGQKFTVATIESGASVSVSGRCKVTTDNPDLRGDVTVEDGAVTVTLRSRDGFYLRIR